MQRSLYNQATVLALAEIDAEIALVQQEYQRIQDNATVLADGSRVYRDEDNGNFYDENDQSLSEEDQLEAASKYSRNDSSRQSKNSSVDKIAGLHKEKQDVIEFQEQQNDRKQRLEEQPQNAEKIGKEIEETYIPDRVQKNHSGYEANPAQEIRSEASTSASKEHFDNGIGGELSSMPAFNHAGRLEQTPTNPAPNSEPDRPAPTTSGMAMG